MKRRLDAGAGYLVIDHSNSPGISQEEARALGMLAAPGGTVLERDVVTCSHCHASVVLNPGRVRSRATCLKCGSYICDGCEAIRVALGGACLPFDRVLDRALEVLARHGNDPQHPAMSALARLSLLAHPNPARIVVPGRTV